MARSSLRFVGCMLTTVVVAACDAPKPGFDVPVVTDTGPTSDGGMDAGPNTDGGMCAANVDTDRDGLNNAIECMLGTNPNASDSDGDGLIDSLEYNYPKVCVGVNAAQRRPPPSCMSTTDCAAGERCLGLNPLSTDTDGDTVNDQFEDLDRNGTIQFELGETDPRLGDTDGDGVNDAMSGVAICRPDGLATLTQVGVNPGTIQLGHDPAWGMSVEAVGTGERGARVLDDAAAHVSAVVVTLPGGADLRMQATQVETQITTAIGAGITPVLVGRSITSYEGNEGVNSLYRIARSTSANALRDLLVQPMVGAAAPASTAHSMSTEFLLEVTTILRPASGTEVARTDVVIGIAPRTDAENPMSITAIRLNDIVNASGVALRDRRLEARCDTFRTESAPKVDFLWTVDTSGSMATQQAKVGRVATLFFNGLRATGVDFRVGVLEAGFTSVNLDSPGFTWIQGNDPNGATEMCEQVTMDTCPTSPGDTQEPYVFQTPFFDGEEPVAAGVVGSWTFLRRGFMGETNLERRFRPGAKIVNFFVTDEPTSETFNDPNDWPHYFATAMDPQSSASFGPVYNQTARRKIAAFFQRNNILTFGMVPVYTSRQCADDNTSDLPRCVIEENRGATIPIGTATDAEVSAAINRIAIAIAGSSSQFRLTRTPITSTLKVRVGNRDVPRSRSEGFDYDAASRTIIFYGNMYRPGFGQSVVVSYRQWSGSVG